MSFENYHPYISDLVFYKQFFPFNLLLTLNLFVLFTFFVVRASQPCGCCKYDATVVSLSVAALGKEVEFTLVVLFFLYLSVLYLIKDIYMRSLLINLLYQ